MENLNDRIADDLRVWEERNVADAKIYSPEERATTKYQSDQLKELKKIYLKYYAIKEHRSDIALKNLKNKIELMESKLHKGYFSRLWEKIKDAVRFRGFVKSIQVRNEQDYDQVRSFLSQTNQGQDFKPQYILGAREIKIPNNDYYQMSPTEIMNSSFDLTRSDDGFNMTSYKVRILSTVDPSNVKEVTFQHRSHQWLNREQIYGLASGEPVLHVDHKGNRVWLKLNQFDKDKDGNTQMMRVSGDDFNIRDAIQHSALKDKLSENAEAALTKKLHNGNVVDLTVSQNDGDRVFRVRADPLGRSLIVKSLGAGNTTVKMGNTGSSLKVRYKANTGQKIPANKAGQAGKTPRKPHMKVVKR
ncbi:hypothetical protein [Chitinophaga niabensis]|uniref:Uncharacterized protein n=1 Tax=Chitinophaga niabensis TaxID=536979 RepID=A0A1N6E5B4_9BACT|nr:hypothetical protein [Chitinophaga niabensis]SIN78222.1 hypothetical protein SAMN04488055_1315 [Chitinophaga niabensis]